MKPRVIGLFSGIGGFELGLQRAGYQIVGMCEIDPWCRRVLRKHWPDVPITEDVRSRHYSMGEADVVTGGFPCQDVSLAGKRAGLAGVNSGLYRELVRALRLVRPRLGIVENVAALLSDGMGTVLGDMAEGRFDAEWDCVPARTVGAPHERDRVFIVTHPCGEGPLSAAQPGIHRGEEGAGARHVEPERLPCSQSLAEDAADPAGQQMGPAGQPRLNRGMGAVDPDAARLGCGQGRARRPPDSFAGVRDEARRNAADPYGARLAFREGIGSDAWQELTPAERDAFGNVGQSVWPDEPALSGVDDGISHWMDRVRGTGNAVIPRIVELIGKAALPYIQERDTESPACKHWERDDRDDETLC